MYVKSHEKQLMILQLYTNELFQIYMQSFYI